MAQSFTWARMTTFGARHTRRQKHEIVPWPHRWTPWPGDLFTLISIGCYFPCLVRCGAIQTAAGRWNVPSRPNAGTDTGPTLLTIAPLVRTGLPVVLLNSTLTADALPVVFTNSRYPGPNREGIGSRSIRSFHEDFRLETHLETAARLSASFPIVSPAARPSELKGRNAFVDGGYFDNSGLYTLMGWLEQAATSIKPDDQREVLLLQVDAFPEPGSYRVAKSVSPGTARSRYRLKRSSASARPVKW